MVALFNTAARCADEASGTWSTVPTWTPRGARLSRRQHLVRVGLVGQVPADELDQARQLRRGHLLDAEVVPVDLAGARGAAGRPRSGRANLDGRRHVRQGGRLADGGRGIGEGVEAVHGLEARPGRRGAPSRLGARQHEPDDERDEQRQCQPGSPPLARSGAKQHPEQRQGTSPGFSVVAPAGVLKGAHPTGRCRASTTRHPMEPVVGRAPCTVWR